jgi:hypothetical protein
MIAYERSSRSLLFLILLGTGPFVRADASPTAREILERCLARYDGMKQYEYHCDTTAECAIDLTEGSSDEIGRTSVIVRQHSDRFEVVGQRYYTGSRKLDREDVRIVVLPGQVLRYDVAVGKPRDQGIFSRRTTDWYFSSRGEPFHGGCLDGYLYQMGNRHLCRVMLDSGAANLLSDEVRGGVACFVVAAVTPYGEIVVSIAKDDSTLAAFTVSKSRSDLFWDQNGGGTIPFDAEKAVLERLGGADSWRASLEDPQFQVVGQQRMVSAATVRVQWMAGRKPRFETVFRSQRTSFRVAPLQFARGAFALDLEEGAAITDIDDRESGVTLVWHNGNVAVANADFASKAPPFATPAPLGRVIGIGATNLLLLSLALAIWWRHLKAGTTVSR